MVLLPANDRVRLYEEQGPLQPLQQGQTAPKQIPFRERGFSPLPPIRGQLTSQSQVLNRNGLMTATQQSQKPKRDTRRWPAYDSTILIDHVIPSQLDMFLANYPSAASMGLTV
jgi:hypothetical protein